ncbi:MFS transporter [Streptomyces sp. NPDC002577]
MLNSLKAALPSGRGAPVFAAATFANAVGMGVYYPFSLLYFQSVLGTSLTAIGSALTVAALLALPMVPATGVLVDRFGPGRVLFVSTAVRAAAFALYPLAGSLPVFVALSLPVALAMRAEQAATPVLAAALAGDGPPGRWLALSRAMFNAGFGLGAVVAGAVISADRDVLERAGAGNAACIAVACLLYLLLPAGRRPPPKKAAPTSERPWRDGPFGIVVAAGAGLWIIAVGMEAALPVYLVRQSAAPAWTVSVLFALNTVLLALFHLPVSHRVEHVRPGVLAAVGAVLHIALPATLLLVPGLPTTLTVIALVAAMTVYTLGELLSSQGVLLLLTALAPEGRRGAYLGFNQMFIGLANAITPLLVTAALDRSASALWWLLTGCATAIAALLTAAGRTRTLGLRLSPQ